MNVDPSGQIVISMSISTIVGIFATLFGFISVTAIFAYVEEQTHAIGKAIEGAIDWIQELWDEAPSLSITEDKKNDPYARPGQKKQGRELKSKAREKFKNKCKYRGGRKPPKKHTPGRDHRKYLILYLIMRYEEEIYECYLD